MRTFERVSSVICACIIALEFPIAILAQKSTSYAPGEVIIKLKEHGTFLKNAEGQVSSGLSDVDAVIQHYKVLETRPLSHPIMPTRICAPFLDSTASSYSAFR